MSDNVTPVEFGKEHNEAVARFARLMGLVEEHHEDIRRDPIKHLKAASDEIVRVRLIVRDAMDAYRRVAFKRWVDMADAPPEPPSHREIDVVKVRREELEALRAMYAVIAKAD